ncbi:MAG: glycine cleavage T C-terminal barrel domain-containing protein [Geminicoccaceae bacterium]
MAMTKEAPALPPRPHQVTAPAHGQNAPAHGQNAPARSRKASARGRLGKGFGLLIDRAKPVWFSFEGRAYNGLEGDVIASALAAAGQWVLSRSFKYHRPRGVLTMAGQDANTLVQLPDEPNVLADRHPISGGLEVLGQNYQGSLEKDDYAWLDKFGRFMPVGFYYRSFFKPKGAWKRWEPRIRAMAGLGRINKEAEHGYYDKVYGFHDVVVVGGGPAGMSAALEAGRAGLDVLLVDEWPMLGGSLAYARFTLGGTTPRRLRGELIADIEASPNVTVMTSAVCTGAFGDNWLPVLQGNRLYKIRAKQVILATGSFEQPMVFRNNDLPGVMLSSAAQRLMRLYAVAPGTRGVIATANDHGYELALDLLEAGIEVAAVVDLRTDPLANALTDFMIERGIRVERGKTVYEAIGKDHVQGVRLARIEKEGGVGEPGGKIACDFVCTATGYSPAGNLVWYAGGDFAYDDETAMHRISNLPSGVAAAGSLNGVYQLLSVLADGRRIGWQAAEAMGKVDGEPPDAFPDLQAAGVTHAYPMFPHPKGREFVDVDEDLQIKDIVDAVKDGYDDIQLVKRYSTLGMGPSQGRNSNIAGIRLVAATTGTSPDEVGTTTARPPFAPEKFAHLAGRSFEPMRLTAMHHRHIEAGAEMMTAGPWMRPAFYGPKGQAEQLIAIEVANCRKNVGLIDVSTLGGLDIRGPDAAEFINRIYIWAYLKQQVGRARYLLMCDETGVIIDDGVACRFHERHYYVTATTSGADAVYRQMLWWNAQWQLDVDIANVTSAYAGVNIAGPRSREVLSTLDSDIDLSTDAFPYMGVREGHIAGIPVRVLRVGFVGELGYEIHCPSTMGEALWDALVEAGEPFAIRPFGVEAQRLMRLEKGHIIIGQDTDGLTQPYEADMGWAVGKKKAFYVGKRAVEIQNGNGEVRKLVGFTLANDRDPCPKECHLVIRDGDIVGRVTSVAISPTLKKVIGLAYVAADQAALGERFEIKIEGGRMIEAVVAPMPFYDPDNERQLLPPERPLRAERLLEGERKA